MINFKKKKPSLEDLLSELTVVEEELKQERKNFRDIEDKYISAEENFLNYKHAYEQALRDYVRHGGDIYANAEALARQRYSKASTHYATTISSLNQARKKVKKAEKIYIKLQEKVASMQPQ